MWQDGGHKARDIIASEEMLDQLMDYVKAEIENAKKITSPPNMGEEDIPISLLT